MLFRVTLAAPYLPATVATNAHRLASFRGEYHVPTKNIQASILGWQPCKNGSIGSQAVTRDTSIYEKFSCNNTHDFCVLIVLLEIPFCVEKMYKLPSFTVLHSFHYLWHCFQIFNTFSILVVTKISAYKISWWGKNILFPANAGGNSDSSFVTIFQLRMLELDRVGSLPMLWLNRVKEPLARRRMESRVYAALTHIATPSTNCLWRLLLGLTDQRTAVATLTPTARPPRDIAAWRASREKPGAL